MNLYLDFADKSIKAQKNWFQRQFSGSMSKDYNTGDGGDYTAAVAAAAYAVNSFYDDIIPKKKVHEHDLQLRDASTRMQEPVSARRSKSLSGIKKKLLI